MHQRLAKQLSKTIFSKSRCNLPILSSKYQSQNFYARSIFTSISYNHCNYAFDFQTINQNSRKLGGPKTPYSNINFGLLNFRDFEQYEKNHCQAKIDRQLPSSNLKNKNKTQALQKGKIAEKNYVMKIREQKKVFGKPYQNEYLLKSWSKPKNYKISIIDRLTDAIRKNKMGQTTLCLFRYKETDQIWYNNNNYAFDFLTISQNQQHIQLNFVQLTTSKNDKNDGHLFKKNQKFIDLIKNSKQSQQLFSGKYPIEIQSEFNSKQSQNVIQQLYHLNRQKDAIDIKQYRDFARLKGKYIKIKYSLVILVQCETEKESYIIYDKINSIFPASCRVLNLQESLQKCTQFHV